MQPPGFLQGPGWNGSRATRRVHVHAMRASEGPFGQRVCLQRNTAFSSRTAGCEDRTETNDHLACQLSAAEGATRLQNNRLGTMLSVRAGFAVLCKRRVCTDLRARALALNNGGVPNFY